MVEEPGPPARCARSTPKTPQISHPSPNLRPVVVPAAMPRPYLTVWSASQAVVSYGCDAAGRAEGGRGGGQHQVLRQPGCKFAAGAAGWVSWAGLCGGRRRAEVFFDSFSGLSRDRSHHVMCTCAKYVLFYCFFVF